VRFDGGFVTSYLHKSRPGPAADARRAGPAGRGRRGQREVGQDIAHQVAAMRPQFVTRDEVPADLLANERRIAEQVTREEGKPEQAIPKIVDGRVNAFLKDIVAHRPGVGARPKKSVKQLLAERGASVKQFARFQIGQAG